MLLTLRSASAALLRFDAPAVCCALSSSITGPSPLQQIPTTVSEQGTTVALTGEKGEARAVYRQLPISSKKLTLVAKLVRKMRVEDALLQCDLVHKKAAGIVQNAIRSARANGVHNHGLDGTKLFIEHCYATNGRDLKRIKIHGRGRSGKMVRRRTHLTVILREDSAPRPRPHRIQETWLQRQIKRERGEETERSHRAMKSVPRTLKWHTKLGRLRFVKKLERQKAKRNLRQQQNAETPVLQA